MEAWLINVGILISASIVSFAVCWDRRIFARVNRSIVDEESTPATQAPERSETTP